MYIWHKYSTIFHSFIENKKESYVYVLSMLYSMYFSNFFFNSYGIHFSIQSKFPWFLRFPPSAFPAICDIKRETIKENINI